MKTVYQVNDPTGAPVSGMVFLAPDQPTMDSMVAAFAAQIAPDVAVQVADEDALVIPPPAQLPLPVGMA